MISHADQYASIFSQNGYDSQKELAKRLRRTPQLRHLSEATIAQYVNNLVHGRKAPSEQLIKGLRQALPEGNLSEVLVAQYGSAYTNAPERTESFDKEQQAKVPTADPPASADTNPPPPEKASARRRVRNALDDWVDESVKTFQTEYHAAGTIIDRAYLADKLHALIRDYQAKHGKPRPAEGDHS